MVGQSPTAEERSAAEPQGPIRERSNVQRLLRSIARVGGIQFQLLLLKTKLTVQQIMLYVALIGGAMAMGLAGMICLVIGLFRVMTHALALVVGVEWAATFSFLILAVILLGGAVIVVQIAGKILAGSTRSDATPGESDIEKRA